MKIRKIDDYRWEVKKEEKMEISAIIYADEELMKSIQEDESIKQAVNVSYLPGIIKYSLAMPDIHAGYGFPIGGVAAFDIDSGIISPGGVGYDISCGVRLLTTDIEAKDLMPRIKEVVSKLFSVIPTGVGASHAIRKLSIQEEKEVCIKGAKWAIEQGFGIPEDLTKIEEQGTFKVADPKQVSARAFERGKDQLGTLGSGNHFLEIDIIEEIYDENVAKVFGLFKGLIAILIHTGSRGFGHQVCDDYLKRLINEAKNFGIELPDKQLACAPIKSQAGQDYYSAMGCAINYALANRQIIMHLTRNAMHEIFPHAKIDLVYDVSHNIAKIETHIIDGKERKVCVHRKGATRAFPPNHTDLPEIYKSVGQPVLIPGDMGRYSFVLVGTEKAMKETFGSTCHGAGRAKSRAQAIRELRNVEISKELEEKGITVMAKDRKGLVEEAPDAYKNVENIVNIVSLAGISRKVAKLRPIGVIKG
jgi:tRNA-splicing ligase RtcB